MARQHVGKRRHVVTIQKHNGNKNAHNHPTYTNAQDWEDFIQNWPCERLNVSGGESVRGRQVTSVTSHVFIGEYYGARDTDSKMRLVHDGSVYSITAAYDPYGTNREFRIEAKSEQ